MTGTLVVHPDRLPVRESNHLQLTRDLPRRFSESVSYAFSFEMNCVGKKALQKRQELLSRSLMTRERIIVASRDGSLADSGEPNCLGD
jgi:hypothetical protein